MMCYEKAARSLAVLLVFGRGHGCHKICGLRENSVAIEPEVIDEIT
jgi:hypothetical protein